MIPFLSLSAQTASLRADYLTALAGVLDTQGFANGPAVAKFEHEFASFLGCREVVCVNSGTTSLHAALLCAGVGPGDEVVTVSHMDLDDLGDQLRRRTPCFHRRRSRYLRDGSCEGREGDNSEDESHPARSSLRPAGRSGPDPRDRSKARDSHHRGLRAIGRSDYKGDRPARSGLVNATSFYPGKNLGAFREGGAVMTDDAPSPTE